MGTSYLAFSFLQVQMWTALCLGTRPCTWPPVSPALSWHPSCLNMGRISSLGTQRAGSHWTSLRPTALQRDFWNKQEVVETLHSRLCTGLVAQQEANHLLWLMLLPWVSPGVSPLMQLCRLHIRKAVGNKRLGAICDLQLPTELIEYLLYQSDPRGDLNALKFLNPATSDFES